MPFRSAPPPCILTIAGSDSGGGAGVQADARTIHARGGFACMAITALTAQNTRGVVSWRPEPPEIIAAQIEAVLGRSAAPAMSERRNRRSRRAVAAAPDGRLPVRAIKTGLLPGASAVRAIAAALASHAEVPLVVDPVIGSTSGTVFLNSAGVQALLEELLPRATLVTPNWPEAEVLAGVHVRTFGQAERAAQTLAADTGCAVLLKGGHAPGNRCRDCLVTTDGAVHWFESERVKTPNTHGTGCVLSAAIASELAKGEPLLRAVATARQFLESSLTTARLVDWNGAGPAFAG